MDVNSINNNINTLNNSPSVQLDRTAQNSAIENVENESLSLNINQYNQRRDELSLNVQSLNEGLAISRIAQNSLGKQEEFLNDIQKSLENLRDEDNASFQRAEDVRTQINTDLQNFNQLAYETKYANRNLLSTDPYEESSSIEINTSNNNFSIEKPNTPQIATDIFEGLNEANLTNPDQLDTAIGRVEESVRQLQTITSEFTEFGNRLESSARENIQEQQNLYNQNKANQNRDFGKESSDFNATNVNANAGYLAASQANIVQEQSVRLLS